MGYRQKGSFDSTGCVDLFSYHYVFSSPPYTLIYHREGVSTILTQRVRACLCFPESLITRPVSTKIDCMVLALVVRARVRTLSQVSGYPVEFFHNSRITLKRRRFF